MNPKPFDPLSEIRSGFQDRIRKNLWNSREEGNKELQQIGTAIAQKCSCRVQFGPMKTEGSALRKLKDDYSQFVREGDWYEMKDLVRLTLWGQDYNHSVQIAAEVKRYCGSGTTGPKTVKAGETIKWLSLMKADEKKPDIDPCGYSGYNYVVRLSNNLPGEIQVNIPTVLYGKGPRKDFCNAAGEGEWHRIRFKYLIESSLAHGLYEIWRVDKAGPNGKEAAALSKKYYDYLRGVPNIFAARDLQEKLTAYKTRNKDKKNDKGEAVFHWDEPILLAPTPTLRSGWSLHTR